MIFLIEFLVLGTLLGIIFTMIMNAYKNVQEVLVALNNFLQIQNDIDFLKQRFADIQVKFGALKDVANELGEAFGEIKNTFSEIFDIFKLIGTILTPICEAVKIGSGAAKGASKVINGITSIF